MKGRIAIASLLLAGLLANAGQALAQLQLDLAYRPFMMSAGYNVTLDNPTAPHGVFASPFGLTALPGDLHALVTVLGPIGGAGPMQIDYFARLDSFNSGVTAADAPYLIVNGGEIRLDHSSVPFGIPRFHQYMTDEPGGSVGLANYRWVYFSQYTPTVWINDPGNGFIGYELAGSTVLGGALNPVPEPETYALLLAGLGLLGIAARRRKAKELAGRPG